MQRTIPDQIYKIADSFGRLRGSLETRARRWTDVASAVTLPTGRTEVSNLNADPLERNLRQRPGKPYVMTRMV
jgi:hypothetical protein